MNCLPSRTYRHKCPSSFHYDDLDRLQKSLRDEVIQGRPGGILFAEVAPVITLGYRKTEEDLLLTSEAYETLGIQRLEVNRGGRATYHGPGQWVVFVVSSLERLTGDSRGVRKFVDALFSAILSVARLAYPEAEIREGKEAGVWTMAGAQGAKVAALGVQIDQGVTQHGLSLNIFPTPTSFQGLRPCGLDGKIAFLEPDLQTAEEREAALLIWRDRLEHSLSQTFPKL